MEWVRIVMKRVAELVAVGLAGFCAGMFVLAALAACYPEATIQAGLKFAAARAHYDFAAVASEPILKQKAKSESGEKDK